MGQRPFAAAGRPAWYAVREWHLWKLPRPGLIFIVAVSVPTYIIAFVLTVLAPLPDPAVLGRVGLLMALGMLHTEVLVGVERARMRLSNFRAASLGHTDLTSVWTFGIALLAPATLGATTACLVMLHNFWRQHRPVGGLAYRTGFARATIMLSVWAGHGVLAATAPAAAYGRGDLVALAAIMLAGLVYFFVNGVVLITGMVLAVPGTSWRRAYHPADHGIELICLGFGAVVAMTLVGSFPWMVVLQLPMLWLAHTGISAYEERRDATEAELADGLVAAAAWQRHARRALRRAARRRYPLALLQVAVDEVPELYARRGREEGHRVLTAAGAALASALEEDDRVGWLHDGLFVVVLTGGVDELPATAGMIADVVREAGAPSARLRVSVGGARFPDDGLTLEQLFDATTRAVREARRDGGDRVVLRVAPDPTRGLAGYRAARSVSGDRGRNAG